MHVNRLLRRYTTQQLALAHRAAIGDIPPLPTSPAAIPSHWRYRLLVLPVGNHHRDPAADHDAYTQAAIYPDAINRAAVLLRSAEGWPNPQDGEPVTEVPFQAVDGP
jgi:hypothetical protein